MAVEALTVVPVTPNRVYVGMRVREAWEGFGERPRVGSVIGMDGDTIEVRWDGDGAGVISLLCKRQVCVVPNGDSHGC